MSIDTAFARRCIRTLERALSQLGEHRDNDEFLYDVYRAACVKEFELVLEQSGKLLRKRLAAFFASNRQADRLPFKDLFRHAASTACWSRRPSNAGCATATTVTTPPTTTASTSPKPP